MGKNNAKILDIKTMLEAGIDPQTKLPVKLNLEGEAIKNDFRRAFRVIDEQDAVNRYKWFNLPADISSEELERMIYYRGQLCFFYYKELDKFYFLPYALDGTIDFYGRFNTVHPIPFAVGTTEEEKASIQKLEQLLSTLRLTVVKDVVLDEDIPEGEEEIEHYLSSHCVLLHDYTKQMSQTILSRQSLNDCFVDMEAEILPYMATALLAGSGIKGMRVNDADCAEETERASKQIRYSALNKKLFVAMTSPTEIQELAEGSPLKSEEFLLALQGIENIRKGTLGIENGGIFQKKAHKLQSEQNGNESSVATVYQDGLSIRQRFCTIANSIWGLEMWCEPSEAVIQQDLNGDGVDYDEQGASPVENSVENSEGGQDND